MSNDCPKCNTHNRAAATFCDSCGAALPGGEGPDPATPPSNAEEHRRVNYGGLLVVFIIVLGGWWFLFGSNADPSTPPAMGGSSQVANPHGGMDSAGNSTGAGLDDMAIMMDSIEQAKASLDRDPLDTASLQTLYQIYAMIGEQGKIRPRLDAAVDALVAKSGELEPSELSETLNDIAYAALYGNDADGAEYALTTVADSAPDNLGIMVLSGDIYFDIVRRYDIDRTEDAIAAYTAYLQAANPETEGNTYWSARTDRATMFLELGEQNDDLELTTKARDEFSAVTEKQPDFFNAWFNLGLASKAVGEEAEAETAWETCVFLAGNEMERYQVAKELALLRGEDPPPVPASLRQPATGGGAANPHGGGMDIGDSAKSGMANPHGGGGNTEEDAHSEEDHSPHGDA